MLLTLQDLLFYAPLRESESSAKMELITRSQKYLGR